MLRPFRSARATGTIVAASLLIATPAVVVPTLGAHNIGPMAGVFAQAAGQPTITKTKWLSDCLLYTSDVYKRQVALRSPCRYLDQ